MGMSDKILTTIVFSPIALLLIGLWWSEPGILVKTRCTTAETRLSYYAQCRDDDDCRLSAKELQTERYFKTRQLKYCPIE